LKNFGLIKEFFLAVELKNDKEDLFELNDGKVVPDLFIGKIKSLKGQPFELFVNLVVISFFGRGQVVK
jgi:hypothetical protein